MGTPRNYYAALKPERTYANVMTTAAGFLLASRWRGSWTLLGWTLLGTTLVVMSACAANNLTDRSIDARMPRTKKRATATGEIPRLHLLALSIVLGAVGFAVLVLRVNWPVVALGAIGYLDYVVLYAWTKRTTPQSTLVGTVSGAVPIMAGWTAYAGRFDLVALTLGLVMACWQMAHFYAIGIFRLEDYRVGGLPVWPVRYGVRNTQAWILAWVVLYLLALGLLIWIKPDYWLRQPGMGTVFTVVVGSAGLYWLWLGVTGFRSQAPAKWARRMFGFSLVNLLILVAGIASSPLLP